MSTDTNADARADAYNEAAAARANWERTDAFINRARVVAAALETYGGAVDWTAVETGASPFDTTEDALEGWHAVEDALERLHTETAEPRATMAFLLEPTPAGDPAPLTAFTTGRTVDVSVGSLVDALSAYIEGEAWDAVGDRLETVVTDPQATAQAATLFRSIAVAALEHRDHQRERVGAALATATDGVGDPITDLEEQPVALMPVNLETRFVGPEMTSAVEDDELWIRVYQDAIHVDAHEPELTAGERRLGTRFWATLWLASHPSPAAVDLTPGGPYLSGAFTDPALRSYVAGIDLQRYSNTPAERYDELKSRGWGRLVDQLGSERAAYVVRALAPTDDEGRDLETPLLTPPSAAADDGSDPEGNAGTSTDEADLDTDGLPPLRFPNTPMRTAEWTKQPNAKLLPDRWVAVLEWERPDGTRGRKTVAGNSIPDPLPIGPRGELEDPSAPGVGEGDGLEDDVEIDGTEWITDIETAFDVGMAIRVPLSELPGYDHGRGIDRLTVVGAKASMDAEATAEALTEQLSSQQYTEGLSLLPAGTPTNVESADPTGALAEDPAAIAPPQVADMDLTDGDLLARGLALETDGRHPFAHVPGAGDTGQLDARHANSVLWPATLGYALSNVLVPNEQLGLESIWNEEAEFPVDFENDGIFGDGESLEAGLAWLDAYRRHFVRYVRSRGPFPTVRVGDQPYGVLPVTATHDTETAIPAVDPSIVQAIKSKELTVDEAEVLGVRTAALIETPELETKTLLAAGAPAKALYDHGIEAVELAESGVEAKTLREMGATVEELAEEGAELPTLIQAGFEVVELEAVGAAIDDILAAGARPEQLARAGLSVAQFAGFDLPADEIIRAGFAAKDVVDAGFSVVDVVRGGAPPSTLREISLDQSTLRALEAPAGSLRFAGVSAADLLRAGYTASELLNGGYDEKELANTGISIGDLRNAGHTAAELANEGLTVEQLRDRGFGPDQLLESGYGQGMLLEAGYTVGELFDAGSSVEALIESNADLGALKTAGVSVQQLLDAGAEVQALRTAGTSADALAAAGVGAERLIEAGYAPKELEAAGIALADVPSELLPAGEKDDSEDRVESTTRRVAVSEPVQQAERDLYGFGFDPATSRVLRARSRSVTAAIGSASGEADTVARKRDSKPDGVHESHVSKTDAQESPDGAAAPTESDGAETESRNDSDGKTETMSAADETKATSAADDDRTRPKVETNQFTTTHSSYGSVRTDTAVSGEDVTFEGAVPYSADGIDTSDLVVDVGSGVLEGSITIPRLTPTDDRIAERIESLLMDLRPIWSDAAATMPFGAGQDDWSVLDALARQGVSRSARVDARIDPQFAPDDAQALESFLKARDLTQFDPRLAHLVLEQVGEGPEIAPYEMVDGRINVFVNLLTAESIDDLRTLSFEVDPSVVDPTGFDEPLATRWTQLPTVGKRAALFAALEDADDPEALLERILPDDAGVSGQKLALAASLAANPTYQETGVYRSFARMLFAHATQREYLEARLRLGVLFDDLPLSGPDFSAIGHPLITVFESPYHELLDTDAPDELVDAVWETDRSADDADDTDAGPVLDASRDVPHLDLGYGIDGHVGDLSNAVDESELEGDAIGDGFTMDSIGLAATNTNYRHSSSAFSTSMSGMTHTSSSVTGTASNRQAETTDAEGVPTDAYTTLAGSQYEFTDQHAVDFSDYFTHPSYADLLEVIAADDASTTALDPRLSEFTDSLHHLETCEPAELATLIGESLDLASHRLDAWWTSLATKRLFELRERQRVGDEAFDAWGLEGYDADEIRSRVDPSLLGGMDIDTDEEGTGDTVDESEDANGYGEARDESIPPAGIYVGGYGVVTDLKPTFEDSPTYIHAPSEQQATTAALLRSGYLAGEADDGENLLDLDLSPERAKDARWLIQGVKRGQSLGELLGYRFERRLHEVTVQPGSPNLLAHRQALREAFPAVLGALEYAEEAIEPAEADRRRELAKSDVLDGYQLLRNWDDDFFESAAAASLPEPGTAAHEKLTELVGELANSVDAVSDLLVAEAVHQLGKGNIEDAGVSLEALAAGSRLPEPTVTDQPRSETGLTHRQLVLLPTEDEVGDPATTQLRAVAEPSLEAWARELLPEFDAVGCSVTCRWQESESDPITGEPVMTTETADTEVTVADLDLAALDVLALAQDAEQEGQSELEQRIAYYVRRHGPAVPTDVTVDIALTDSGSAPISMAALVEIGRSLSSLIEGGRSADGTDLSHPADQPTPGYDEASLETVTERGYAIQDRLESVAGLFVERLPPLGVDSERLVNTPALEAVADTGTVPESDSEATGDDDAGSDDSPVGEAERDVIDEDRALTTRADAVCTAVDDALESGLVPELDDALADLETAAVGDAFEALADALPAGVIDADALSVDRTVRADSDQLLTGRVGAIALPPDVTETDGPDSDSSGDGDGSDDGSSDGASDDGSSGDEDDDSSGDDDDDSTIFAGPAFSKIADLGLGMPPWLGSDVTSVDVSDPRTPVTIDDPVSPVTLGSDGALDGTVDLQDDAFLDAISQTEPDAGSSTDEQSVTSASDQSDTSGDDQPASDGSDDADEYAGDTAGTDGAPSVDPALEGQPLEVVVWGVSETDLVWKTATATIDDGRFSITMDFDDVEPGTRLSIAGSVDDQLVYSASGHVLPTEEPADVWAAVEAVLEDNRAAIGALCWLAAVRESLALETSSTDDGASETKLAALETALERLDFDAVAGQAEAATDQSPETVDAIESLAALETVDLAALIDALEPLIDLTLALGLEQAVDVVGRADGHLEARLVPVRGYEGVGDTRRRLRRVATDVGPLEAGVPPRTLAYDHAVAHAVASTPEPAVTARALDALVHAPAWAVGALEDVVADPAVSLARIDAWTFEGSTASLEVSSVATGDNDDEETENSDDEETGTNQAGDDETAEASEPVDHEAELVADLRAIAGATADLEALFTGVADDAATATTAALSALADSLEAGNVSGEEADVTATVTAAAEAAGTESTSTRTLLEGVASSDPNPATAVRTVVLEHLREPLLAASFAGVYGAVPSVPVGDSVDDERTLRRQAVAVLGELDERLLSATALDPRTNAALESGSLAQQVETQRDRIEGLLEDVTVLLPFAPSNESEIRSAFTETPLPDDAGPLAVETWFQRVAQVRERPATLRESLSYAEALTGELHRDLTVGQLPSEPGGDWVGADGVEPEANTLSLIAQFGSGLEPMATDGRLVGLFVDEWVETIPAETERTGLALQCEDPGNRPPQSILLALPPENESWSLGALVGAVTETMTYAQLRAVDLEDLAQVDGARTLFPAIYLPNDTGTDRPRTPSVNVDAVGWYDQAYDRSLLPRYVFDPPTDILSQLQTLDIELSFEESDGE
ncbi:hypothetical protein OB919_06240 [Halobacteria archaeon AArc-curdl1]|uniref:Uncharacterized protein n=1 Tax=Natronosalvus hydrolyticus TaxID=2979988 RepID=A0AAP2Z8W5_9EURY|nr:hypothetical protein [Halobacteria archaeon AArc-curdl1]